jgi:peptidoglycan hydrolase CwlO-like protein
VKSVDKEILEILKGIQIDIKNMQTDIKDTQADIKGMEADIKDTQTDIKHMKTDIKDLKTRQEETYQIFKALEHSAEINKAEHDKMTNDIAYIKGTMESIKKDVSTVEIVTANNYADIAKLKAVK